MDTMSQQHLDALREAVSSAWCLESEHGNGCSYAEADRRLATAREAIDIADALTARLRVLGALVADAEELVAGVEPLSVRFVRAKAEWLDRARAALGAER